MYRTDTRGRRGGSYCDIWGVHSDDNCDANDSDRRYHDCCGGDYSDRPDRLRSGRE